MRALLISWMVVCAPQAFAATTTYVPAGGNLQRAINSAAAGDTILLQAGATFVGNFVLPVHAGSDFVTIRSSAPSSALPAEGTRVTPSFAGALARIQSPNSMAAMMTRPGAHHYVLQFLQFGPNAG